ncbi:MAG: 3-isopropylmalate dehydratase small subunit [Dehalococcoidia bacterium]|nr:3-isopropylmalate dehydratase small subunit [Dehalococcoidia bacterium]
MSDLSQTFRGRVWKLGDSVDTGQLAPGGPNLVPNDPIADIKAKCLRTLRPEFGAQVQPGDIVVAGTNFGCGSSRSTGVVAVKACGIQAVLAESVSRLYLRNSVAQGLLAFNVPGIAGAVSDGDTLEVDYAASMARNLTTGDTIPLKRLPPTVERIYALGGIGPVIAQRLAAEGIFPPTPAPA